MESMLDGFSFGTPLPRLAVSDGVLHSPAPAPAMIHRVRRPIRPAAEVRETSVGFDVVVLCNTVVGADYSQRERRRSMLFP